MISFVIGFLFGLAVVVVVDLWRYCMLSEKDRFYQSESKRYGDLRVGIVELKKR